MIKKIISGGQTGADQAALDAAIQWRIPHGGWISKGRLTEAGRLPDKYRLSEMPDESSSKMAEQNIIDSDGTLVISHGELTGVPKNTHGKADELKKPCLHIDLEKINAFQAAHVLKKWASDNNVETLNVTGPRISRDKYIYQAAMRLLTTLFHMEMIESGMPDPENPYPLLPSTIKEVIETLINEMPLRDKSKIANIKEAGLTGFYPTLGSYIRNKFFWNGNKPLMQDCMKKSGVNNITEDEASNIIIHALWEQLKGTHRLRIVK